MKIRNVHKQAIKIGNGHSLVNRLRSFIIVEKQNPAQISHHLPVSIFEQSSPYASQAELEAQRNQEVGRAYAGLIPPR